MKERTGRPTAWRHFRRAFEEESGADLGWFFEAWVVRPGAPAIRLDEVGVVEGAEPVVRLALSATSPVRALLPVEIRLAEGPPIRRCVDAVLGPEPTGFEWLLPAGARPVAVAVDPDADAMRALDPEEVPATLRLAFGAERLRVVLPAGASEEMAAAYRRLADGLGERLAIEVVAGEPGSLPEGAVLLLGGPAENALSRAVLRGLGPGASIEGATWRGGGVEVAGDGAALVACARNGRDGIVVVVAAATPAALDAAGPKLVHYGTYGYLLFDAGRNVAKGVLDSPASPLVRTLE